MSLAQRVQAGWQEQWLQEVLAVALLQEMWWVRLGRVVSLEGLQRAQFPVVLQLERLLVLRALAV
jgi:hypothetical protein